MPGGSRPPQRWGDVPGALGGLDSLTPMRVARVDGAPDVRDGFSGALKVHGAGWARG